MSNTKVGSRIKHARELRRLSQAQLAQKLGVTKQTISNYENGVRTPDFEMLDTLSCVLDVSMAYLVGAIEEPRYYPKPNEDEPYTDPLASDDDELWTLREEMRRDPERRRLFKLAAHATLDDVKAADALLNALKATNPDFYDGDDPA